VKERNWINDVLSSATREIKTLPAWMRLPEIRNPASMYKQSARKPARAQEAAPPCYDVHSGQAQAHGGDHVMRINDTSKLQRQAEFIVKVLLQTLWPEDSTPEIEAARASINHRYAELKSHNDFSTSAQQARVEWLTRYLLAGPREREKALEDACKAKLCSSCKIDWHETEGVVGRCQACESGQDECQDECPCETARREYRNH